MALTRTRTETFQYPTIVHSLKQSFFHAHRGTKQAERAPGVARADCFEPLARRIRQRWCLHTKCTYRVVHKKLVHMYYLHLKTHQNPPKQLRYHTKPCISCSTQQRFRNEIHILHSAGKGLMCITVMHAPRLANTPGQPLETGCAS